MQQLLTAYLPDYSAIPSDEQLSQLTDLILFSAKVRGNGTLDLSQLWLKLKAVRQIKEKMDIKISLCIGGWERSTGFSKVVQDDHRQAFARSIAELLELYNLDGIDMDWEFPIREEYPDYIKTLYLIKREIGNKTLSLALKHDLALEELPVELFGCIDRIHLMAYDMQGCHSGIEESLYLVVRWGKHIDRINSSFKKEQIILGLPFYGKGGGLIATYADLVKAGAGAGSDLWRGIKYNGISTVVEKKSYCKENGFGGIMIWELSQDLPFSDERSLLRALVDKPNNLSMSY